jgi:epoxyqueuosine reductase
VKAALTPNLVGFALRVQSSSFALTVRRPVESGIEKRESRHISQKVCPWNRFATESAEAAFLPCEGLDGPSLIEWMTMTQEEFSARFKGSPIKRAKRRGLLRNVAVALGNWGSPEAVPALAIALNDAEPLIRGHAAWALGRIPDERSVDALRARLLVEEDEWVVSEIKSSLDEES